MSIYDRFFKNKGRADDGVDVTGVAVIPTKCPTCGMTGDFHIDPNKHDFFGIFEVDKNTHCHALECPYCKAGMLLCIRKSRLMGIEPFAEDMSDVMQAVARTKKKLGL